MNLKTMSAGSFVAGGPFFDPEEEVSPMQTTLTSRAQGDLVVIDETVVDSVGHCYVVKQPATADLVAGIFGVLLDPTPATAGTYIVRVQFMGDITALIAASGVALGTSLAGVNASHALGTTITTLKIIAKCREATTGTNQIKKVTLDGIHGFGKGT